MFGADQAVKIAHEIAEHVLTPLAAEVDHEARWPEEGIRALLAGGLGGLVVGESVGGLGLGLTALARVCETLGGACPSTAICFGMHCVGSATIAATPTEPQTTRYLEPIARGEHLTTLALSEPGTGSHFYLPQTVFADLGGSGFAVSGTKTFVTNGGHADSYVVSARRPDVDGTDLFSCLVIPADAQGLDWGPGWTGFGMRGNDARTVELRDVRVEPDDLLGRMGDEIWYVFNVIAPYFLAAMTGTYLGIASSAFQIARDHLRRRVHEHTGMSLATLPVLQHRLGSIWTVLTRTRQLVFHATASGDGRADDALPALLAAKAEVARATVDVVTECMTLVGGIGYRDDSRLGRMLRDARAADVMAPTTDLALVWAGRALLDLPLLADG